MPDIHIERPHALGLTEARRVAQSWSERAAEKFSVACVYEEGDDADVLRFDGSGVDGEMRVTADQFDLHVKLGFLVGVFQGQIADEINRQFDTLLGPVTENNQSTTI